MTTLYGIKNCDTVKKARRWLEANNIDYRFHDLRDDGLDTDRVADWIKQLGWEVVVNKRSTTWKQLGPQQREQMDADAAVKTIVQHPTLVKRPLLDMAGQYHVGFKADDYQQHFGS